MVSGFKNAAVVYVGIAPVGIFKYQTGSSFLIFFVQNVL